MKRRLPALLLLLMSLGLAGCEKRIRDEVRFPAETSPSATYVANR